MGSKGQHYDSRSTQIRNTIESSDEHPLLHVVQSPTPAINPRIATDFKHLDDGRVIELVEDPSDATKTKLAVFDRGKIYLTDSVDNAGQTIVPIGRFTDGLEDIILPRSPLPYESVEQIFYQTLNLIARCITLQDPYPFVVAAFVLNSWFADRLRPPVYLLLTGLPQSGKTTLLEMLKLLCRRPLLVSDISSVAAFDACSRFGCTLLIDENDWRADQNSRALRKQLRAGTSKGLLTKHIRKTQHAYGAKVLSGVELPDDAALLSRCIHMPMNETDRSDLRKPWDTEIVKAADVLRGQLLKFRLDHYASVSPRVILGAEELRPRSRDLLSSLLAPLDGVEVLDQLLLAFFVGIHDPSTRDLLSPAQSAVVAALFEFAHHPVNAAFVQIMQVAKLATQILHLTGERFVLSPRETSSILASMGLSERGRSNRGSHVNLDKKTISKIHKLKRLHDVQWPESESLRVQTDACIFCKDGPAKINISHE
jgi:hypothetical protein